MSIAPPRRTGNSGGPVPNPHKRKMVGQSARHKPMTLSKAILLCLSFFLILAALLYLVGRTLPDSQAEFIERAKMSR